MQFYSSDKRKKVEFKPLKDGEVKIYLCGPTVYDDAHLGHAKSAVSFDLLRRFLIESGFRVEFARNYTDIDDKILKKMKESGKSLEEITSFYIKSYEADMSSLNILEPTFKPLATKNLLNIIKLIQKLLDIGDAYITSDGVYFEVSKDKKYLTLSNKFDEDTQARVENSGEKRDEKDFALWKFDNNYYDAPFGKGRPGWHSECVAMIKDIFGSNICEFKDEIIKDEAIIDIHAGGMDLLFPHHENEAAQCRCAYKTNLANYWLHNGFVQINNEKMSKSLGNSFFIKDALRLFCGEALRFYLLSTHYRANFNFSEQDLRSSKKFLDKIYRLKMRLIGIKPSRCSDEFRQGVLDALGDDLNISKALSLVNDMVENSNKKLDLNSKDKALKQEIVANLEFIRRVFGILELDEFEYFRYGLDEQKRALIEALIDERSKAKSEKNYALADEIRQKLSELGVNLMDTALGVKWEIR